MYDFEIEIAQYKRVSPILQDTKSLYVSGICIAAKNEKFGNFYFSKYVNKRIGVFANVAGSVAYPILFPKSNKVVLYIKNFPKMPFLENAKENITIKNICLSGKK